MTAAVLNFVLVLVLLVLFAWLTRRAWRARNVFLKVIGTILAGLVTLVLAGIVMTAGRGLYLLVGPRNFPVVQVQSQGTPEQIARGEKLAVFLCVSCHSSNGKMPMSGGKNLSQDTGLPLGDFYPPNLTPGGDLKNWSDGEILRAIREGEHKNGRTLAMPAVLNLRNLSDEDALAIIAFLRNQPSVQNQTPPMRPSLLVQVLLGIGLFQVNTQPVNGPVSSPPAGPTIEYGQYLVNISDCRSCHGPDLGGGKPPSPVGPNLRVVKGWTQDQFINTMRTGVAPDGHHLQDVMPWKQVGSLDDEGLAALYQYLHGLPPLASSQ